MSNQEPIPYCSLTCQCGHRADLDAFCRTPIAGELPRGMFQCPACGYAFKRVESGHTLFTVGGESLIIPGKVRLVPCQGML